MSYILDALRRADAERTRGAVPGLHAQPLSTDTEPSARNFTPLIWAAGAAGVLAVAVVVVLVFAPWRGAPATDARAPLAPAPELNTGRDNAPVTTAQGETPAARAGAIDPAALPVQPPISRTNTAAADGRAQPAASSLPAYPPARPPATNAPARLADRAAAGRVAALESTRSAAQNAQGRPSRTAGNAAVPGASSPYATANAAAAAANAQVEHYGPPVASAAAPARPGAIVNINDLPPATRSQLPRLTVGGAIYSESPSARMVIFNGQVYHEGDKPAADTVLEQIRLKSAVLNYRGQRYEVTY
jgi:general secretion pathway protein B